jgi:hypothetical protein
MLATLLTLSFASAGTVALTVIGLSLVKGFAAASALRRQFALCSGTREVTIRHQRAPVARTAIVRASRQPSRLVPVLAKQAPRRVAA